MIPPRQTRRVSSRQLLRLIEHSAHLLPSQGPITVFVHHNALHAFEDLRFEAAVKEGAAAYGCNPYDSEEFYRRQTAKGRIRQEDLEAVLMEDLGEDADQLIGFMGTRFHLRLAMLEHPLRQGPEEELRWVIAETDALQRFRSEATKEARTSMIAETCAWAFENQQSLGELATAGNGPGARFLLDRFDVSKIQRWGESTWEALTLHLLWQVCHKGVHGLPRFVAEQPRPIRHAVMLFQATGLDCDRIVNNVLIRFCAAFLDQGFALWPLPKREEGFFKSFTSLYRNGGPMVRWLKLLPNELERIERGGLSALESIGESLERLGVPEAERQDYITQTLLALRGWAGMIWQMETNAAWAVHPASAGTLVEYLAVRLILEQVVLEAMAKASFHAWRRTEPLASRLARQGCPRSASRSRQARVLGFPTGSGPSMAPCRAIPDEQGRLGGVGARNRGLRRDRTAARLSSCLRTKLSRKLSPGVFNQDCLGDP